MDKDIIYFQLGKLSVSRKIIEEASKLFNGYPVIAKPVLEAYYKLNEATNLIDKEFNNK